MKKCFLIVLMVNKVIISGEQAKSCLKQRGLFSQVQKITHNLLFPKRVSFDSVVSIEQAYNNSDDPTEQNKQMVIQNLQKLGIRTNKIEKIKFTENNEKTFQEDGYTIICKQDDDNPTYEFTKAEIVLGGTVYNLLQEIPHEIVKGYLQQHSCDLITELQKIEFEPVSQATYLLSELRNGSIEEQIKKQVLFFKAFTEGSQGHYIQEAKRLRRIKPLLLEDLEKLIKNKQKKRSENLANSLNTDVSDTIKHCTIEQINILRNNRNPAVDKVYSQFEPLIFAFQQLEHKKNSLQEKETRTLIKNLGTLFIDDSQIKEAIEQHKSTVIFTDTFEIIIQNGIVERADFISEKNQYSLLKPLPLEIQIQFLQ